GQGGAAQRGEPVKLLIPSAGPSGPELLGISLHRLGIGQMLGGQLMTLEVDAEIDRSPLLPVALAMTLSGSGAFTAPDELEQRILCRELYSIVVFPGGAPLLIPLFFEQIGLKYSGIDGLKADVRWSLPAPRIDLPGALRAIAGARALLAGGGARAAVSALPELR